jgi:hypothetical protein
MSFTFDNTNSSFFIMKYDGGKRNGEERGENEAL